MILHTHQIEEDDKLVDYYVLHISPADAEHLANAIMDAIEATPDVDAYSITLGKADELVEPQIAGEYSNGLILPESGLIAP